MLTRKAAALRYFYYNYLLKYGNVCTHHINLLPVAWFLGVVNDNYSALHCAKHKKVYH